MKLQWKLFSIVFVLAGFATTLLPQTPQSEPATTTVERARKLELVDGNLEEAMNLYRGLLGNFATVRPATALALVGLGRSYQKTGDEAEARNLYERVLKNYSDQKDAAAQATARLASLGVPVTGRVTPSEARFVFALPQRARWEWYRPSSPANQREYSWAIDVDNGERSFGFWLWKQGLDAQTLSGTIDELVEVGQKAMLEATGDKRSLVQSAQIRVRAVGKWLTVSVTDPQTLQKLFAGKPTHATYSVMMPGQNLRETPVESKGKIPIVYEGF